MKKVLANSLRSPPRSPTFHCSSVQPSPQEPTYTSATYKPPSLYPQKKQRTEYQLEPVPPFSAKSASGSPFLRADAFEPRGSRAAQNDPAIPFYGCSTESRRKSLQAYSGYPSITSPRPSQRQLQPFFIEPSPSNGVEHAPYKRPHNVAMSPPEYGQTPAQRGIAFEPMPQHGFNRRLERRDSTQASHDHGDADVDSEYDRRVHDAMDSRLQHTRGAGREDFQASQYARRVELSPDDRRREAHAAHQQSSQPSFFMPTQYDYRNGRARKRSNLPKPSTEVMKTWFDQVCQDLCIVRVDASNMCGRTLRTHTLVKSRRRSLRV